MRAAVLVTVALVAVTLGPLGSAQACMEKIPDDLIQQLLKMTKALTLSLPVDGKRSQRFLPSFNTPSSCRKRQVGVWELKQMLDVYDRVFSSERVEKRSPRDFLFLLSRIRQDVERCLVETPNTETTWSKRQLRRMNRTFEKLTEEGVSKAVGEFRFVLHWISEIRDAGRTPRKHCQ